MLVYAMDAPIQPLQIPNGRTNTAVTSVLSAIAGRYKFYSQYISNNKFEKKTLKRIKIELKPTSLHTTTILRLFFYTSKLKAKLVILSM